jgi:hypothetical protein
MYYRNCDRQGATIAKRPYIQGPYNRQEIELLKKEYPSTSAVLLASKLKRSLISVQRELRELGIGRRKEKSWTPEEVRILRSDYKTMAVWEVANRLNKTPSEIKRKAASIGLKK